MRLPMSHRAVMAGIRLMFSRPDRLPDSWYAAGADEFLRVMRDWPHRRAFYATLRQIYVEEPFGTRGFWTRLTGVTAPALFVWGERDRLVPASFARHVSTALPNSRSVVLPDCGHVPQFELPDRTLELTREFLTA
jgi:pimeloyl-ACP methyl ester carboxylesterase